MPCFNCGVRDDYDCRHRKGVPKHRGEVKVLVCRPLKSPWGAHGHNMGAAHKRMTAKFNAMFKG